MNSLLHPESPTLERNISRMALVLRILLRSVEGAVLDDVN